MPIWRDPTARHFAPTLGSRQTCAHVPPPFPASYLRISKKELLPAEALGQERQALTSFAVQLWGREGRPVSRPRQKGQSRAEWICPGLGCRLAVPLAGRSRKSPGNPREKIPPATRAAGPKAAPPDPHLPHRPLSPVPPHCPSRRPCRPTAAAPAGVSACGPAGRSSGGRGWLPRTTSGSAPRSSWHPPRRCGSVGERQAYRAVPVSIQADFCHPGP